MESEVTPELPLVPLSFSPTQQVENSGQQSGIQCIYNTLCLMLITVPYDSCKYLVGGQPQPYTNVSMRHSLCHGQIQTLVDTGSHM